MNDVRLVSSDSAIVVLNAENVTVNGGGGADMAHFYDTAGDDLFESAVIRGTMTGSVGGVNYRHHANNFAGITAYATAGGANDRANITDWVGDDVLTIGVGSTTIRAASPGTPPKSPASTALTSTPPPAAAISPTLPTPRATTCLSRTTLKRCCMGGPVATPTPAALSW